MVKEAVAKAFGDIRAALALLDAEVDGAGSLPFSAADPLAGLADGCLDILAGVREVESGIAGLKAKAAVRYAETADALAGPDVPVVTQEMRSRRRSGACWRWGRGLRGRSWPRPTP